MGADAVLSGSSLDGRIPLVALARENAGRKLQEATILIPMAMTFEELEKEARALPGEERLLLAERLMVDIEVDPRIEQLWIAEAERRARELTQGRVRGIDGDSVMAEAEAILDETP